MSAKDPREFDGEFDRLFDTEAPLRVLKDFRPESEWVLEPGDMLYLPPGWAHEGTAVDACLTCSIGFRAPSRAELAAEFLAWIGERADIPGLYADPSLRPAANAAEIPRDLVLAAARAVRAASRWSEKDLTAFVGSYLTAPKPRVAFTRPLRPLSRGAFARRCRRAGVALDARSQLLFRAGRFFVNGETFEPAPELARRLKDLAHRRALEPLRRAPAGLFALLHRWYLSGWLRPDGSHGQRHEGRVSAADTARDPARISRGPRAPARPRVAGAAHLRSGPRRSRPRRGT